MASVEFITKRIEGKQKEITKLEKKLARIIKAQESNWENNPYYYTERDLKWTTKDLEEAKASLAKYEEQLATETEKDNSRDVKPLIEFLNGWADRVYESYATRFANYQIELADYYRKDSDFCDYVNSGRMRKDPDGEEKYEAHRKYRKYFKAKWRFIEPYVDGKKFNALKLKKELEQEKKAKYDDLINRANSICGTIKDATGLSIGEKGELNGLVIGDRGTAYIETIGAGGYNIQCYHFRTLIHERK